MIFTLPCPKISFIVYLNVSIEDMFCDQILDLHMLQASQAGNEGATAEKGPWLITLDAPTYTSVMSYADNRHDPDSSSHILSIACISEVNGYEWSLRRVGESVQDAA